MWICNHCGSSDITCNFKSDIYGYSRPNALGIARLENINSFVVSSIGDIETDLYWCEKCQKEARDIIQLAHWVDEEENDTDIGKIAKEISKAFFK